ncbi:MAG: peptidoglycan-binding domain-containing protein [Candidatus Nealsonbacteria bacterium]|nr:peptidoglycan-binding domain-containing protein [Candidatus Nealsonbacteria bacterium]
MGKLSKTIFIFSLFIFFPLFVFADDIGAKNNFSINPSYDLQKREETSATLQKVSNQIYYYIDDNWWNGLDSSKKEAALKILEDLSIEFDKKIYPTLVSYFGPEWRPGIDKDSRITVLLHPMNESAGGYFNSGDEYPKIQNPKSNQREMVYLNTQYIEKSLLKSFLAHEFVHMITFNQKDKTYDVSEDVWLNEARADYASTLLGYDDVFEGSNLQLRVKMFLEKPSDSLITWENSKYDYGAINLFTQYLVENYGKEILTDSISYKSTGIASIKEALKKRGFSTSFSQIFENWTIAVLINDCSQGDRYCYKNLNLKKVKISPQLNFLPLTGESSLQFTNANYDWSANWYKIVGGKGKLILEFDGQDEGDFSLSFVLCDLQEVCRVQKMSLDGEKKGQTILEDFSKNYQSLTIIPAIHTKDFYPEGSNPTYLFTWKVSAVEKTEDEKEAELISSLIAQIESLKKELARLQALIGSNSGGQNIACQKLERNLYSGMTNSADVRCLQQFLKNQGAEIYSGGLVTGNFGILTYQAVVRFQEKYRADILTPSGLEKGTGFVGVATRYKINQMLM